MSVAFVRGDDRFVVDDVGFVVFRWCWKLRGSRTGGFPAILIDSKWTSPSGSLSTTTETLAAELAELQALAPRTLEVSDSVDLADIKVLIQKSKLPHRWRNIRGDSVRSGKKVVDVTAATIGDFAPYATLVAVVASAAAAGADQVVWP